MPVDLSIIPNAAKSRKKPSLKRWLLALLALVVSISFLGGWLGSSKTETSEIVFWHGFITIPLVIGIIIICIRWLVWLAYEWPAIAWNNVRILDMKDEIERGQRTLLLDEVCVHLPHVVSFGKITEQLLLPGGVVLPAVAEEDSNNVTYKASFEDYGQPLPERTARRIYALLKDNRIQSALSQRYSSAMLTVIIQTGLENELDDKITETILRIISPLLPVNSTVNFMNEFGFADIDFWMDTPSTFETLLILSINLHKKIVDGQGEAATALLIRNEETESKKESFYAKIHRPEFSDNHDSLSGSVKKAMQWGKASQKDIAWLWLAGVGIRNKSQVIISSVKSLFPNVDEKSQFIDIDRKCGNTGSVSPWLVIALAAGNVGAVKSPQFIISHCASEEKIWGLIIYPPSYM